MALASAAMLLVLMLRGPFARLLGAGPAYALWAVPALRLVMPPLPQLAPGLPHLVPAETFVVFVGDAAAPLPPEGGPGPWMPWLLALWAGGAAAFLLWQWLGYSRFLAELNRSARLVGAHAGLPLVESEAVEGPLALGLLDRRIVVPADFGRRYNAAERRLALDHEAVHHRRGDLWWNHVGLLILALNWFNPIAWAAFRAFRADQELACDARVTATAGPEACHDYARALIKSASRPGLIAACPLNHADQLKRRLKMMKSHRQSRTRMFTGAAAVLAFAGATLVAGGSVALAQPDPAPPAQAAPPPPHAQGERREERIIIRTQRVGHGEGGDHPAATAEHHGETTTRSEHMYVMTTRTDGGHPGERHIEMHGPDGQVIIPHCDNGQADEINEGTDGNRTRIVLCSSGNVTPAQRAERLQHARDRIAADGELSAEQKARVTAALDRQIARLRGQ
jgi:beta-lactamase regulating signal transducer with metallopeptidase domain